MASYELPPDMDEGFAVERMVIDYSVYYALSEAPELCCDPPPLLIAAHGYGQSCRNFMRMIRVLQHRGFHVVAPQAPNHFRWTLEPPTVGFAWVTEFEPENTINEIMVYIKRLIDEVGEKITFDPSKIFLLGFSQGAALAYRIAAHGVIQPAGLIACSGKLPEEAIEGMAEAPKFPIMVIHGEDDDSVPIDDAKETVITLKEQGFDVETQFFDGQHLMPADKLEYVARWIQDQVRES